MFLKIKKNIRKILSFVLLIISGCLSFIYVYKEYNIDSQNKKKIEAFLNSNNYDSINKINNDNNNNRKIKSDIIDENYELILEIPKINLKKGIYNYTSKNNDVNKNIMLLKQSNMPNVKNGNVILASHSGNSNISYFKYLNKLNINDDIIIYYKGYKYIYKVNNLYKKEKKGVISIERNINKNTLTLITCDKSDKNYQLVFIAYLDFYNTF